MLLQTHYQNQSTRNNDNNLTKDITDMLTENQSSLLEFLPSTSLEFTWGSADLETFCHYSEALYLQI